MRRQNVVDWMVTGITGIQSPSIFLLNWILICYWTVPHFQTICLPDLCPNFNLHSGDKTGTYTWFFSANLSASNS
jgi:hypothetical protein